MKAPRPKVNSTRPSEIRSAVANSWKVRTGSGVLRSVTAEVNRICFVAHAIAAMVPAVAEFTNPVL